MRNPGGVPLFAAFPPPGPSRREFWHSPVRGPCLTAVLGSVLLAGIPVIARDAQAGQDAT